MTVYILHHQHIGTNGTEEVKLLGVFSSKVLAEQAISETYQHQPGFRDNAAVIDPSKDDATSGFIIDPYKVDALHWRDGFGSDSALPTS